MKKIIALTIAAATLALSAAPISAESRAERGEAKFAELTEGRVAGEGQSCINTFNTNRLTVIENVGISYERGDTIWIARASNANQLSGFDIPVFERRGSQLCRTDVIRTIDRSSGHFSGVVFLGDFVPYTLAETDTADG